MQLTKSPGNTFRKFLKSILKAQSDRHIIIALDEYEILDYWLRAGKLSQDFIEILTSWIQLDERLAFVLAGWHNLEEMGDNWKNPVYGKFIPKPVKFLSQSATYQLLREPNENFTLGYETATLKSIYELTHGQPYLVNLLGFHLVEHYNEEKFLRGHNQRQELLTSIDLDTILANKFFPQVGNYFHGLWEQAQDGSAHSLATLLAKISCISSTMS